MDKEEFKGKTIMLKNELKQTIIVVAVVGRGNLLKFFVYFRHPLVTPPNSYICEVEPGSSMGVQDKNYAGYKVIDHGVGLVSAPETTSDGHVILVLQEFVN